MSDSSSWNTLVSMFPKYPDWNVPFDSFFQTPLRPYLLQMINTPQNPEWHAEGNVYIHTKMVCKALADDRSFQESDEMSRTILFASALLHDIGKIPTTICSDGIWESPNHTIAGAELAKDVLIKNFSLEGEYNTLRDCICLLIRYHSVPVHFYHQKHPERKLCAVAAEGEKVPGFTLSLLKILVYADLNGRISSHTSESLSAAESWFQLAEQLGIMNSPQ